MSRRKPLIGRSGGSSSLPPRDRRDSQAAAQGESFEFPLRTLKNGKVGLQRSEIGALGVDPSRGIFVIVHPPLMLSKGSPFGITLPLEKATMVVVNGRLAARLSAEQIAAIGGTVADELERLRLNKENKIEKGAADGYAPLDSSGLVPTANLPPTMPPAAHAADHEDGGPDEMNVTGLSGALADPQTPTAHAGDHADGGPDEINVTGLSGQLADPQIPDTHAGSHQDGGGDEIAEEFMTGLGQIPKGDSTTGTLDISWFPLGSHPGQVMAGDDGRVTALTDIAYLAGANNTFPHFDSSAATETLTAVQTRAALNVADGATASDAYSSFSKVGTTNFEAWQYANAITGVGATTRTLAANVAHAIPYIAPARSGVTIDRVGIFASAAVGNVRIALYDEGGGIPVNRITDFGAVAVAAGVASITISQALTPGKRYWLCHVYDNTPAVRALSSNGCHVIGVDNALGTAHYTFITATMTYGAWASTFPTAGMAAVTGNCPTVAVRYSA